MNDVKLITTKGYGNQAEMVMILAHGAGAPMDSPFMEALAKALDEQGIACVRFEFPYMQKRREDGKKRPPDRQPVLLEYFARVVAQVRRDIPAHCRLLVGGKSMGGRMASLLAGDAAHGIEGVVCYGYPFHPPGKLDRWRTEHLQQVTCPLMIVQGTRDPFGKPAELAEQGEIAGISELVWLDGGNHDFQPPVRHPETQASLIRQAAVHTRQFAAERIGKPAPDAP